jgi:hypothetical protein
MLVISTQGYILHGRELDMDRPRLAIYASS